MRSAMGLANDAAAYRAEQEAFVSGHGGGSVWEIEQTVFTGVLAHLFARALDALLRAHEIELSWPVRLAIDHLAIVVPALTVFTLVDLTVAIQGALLFSALALIALRTDDPTLRARASQAGPTTGERRLLLALNSDRKPFLSAYRSMMMLSTCICILAVDFRVFPRRFAKTENFGTSLMDVGVGSFVLANSLTAGSSLDRPPSFKTLLPTVPLLILGFGRLGSVKMSGYQEHASEYGVHWNFFFTLAAMPVLTLLVRTVLSPRRCALAGVLLCVGYQVALTFGGLEDYVLNAPRTDLISMNKEGLFSVFGYFSIFLFGSQLGRVLLERKRIERWRGTARLLIFLDLVLWALWLGLTYGLGMGTSRRLANLCYVIWVLAYNLPFIAGYLAVDLWMPPAPLSVLYEAVNRNQLALFLLANVLTGAVNFSMRTLRVPDGLAYLILNAYTAVIVAMAALWHAADLTIKFW